MSRTIGAGTTYSDRLLKLIPVEFIATYLAISQIASVDLALRQPILLFVIVLFAVLIPTYLYRVHSVTSRLQMAMTTISFLVWTYTLGDAFKRGPLLPVDVYHPIVASTALVLWTSLAPFFGFHGDAETGND